MKLLENYTRKNHCSFRVGKDFSARAQETQTTEKKSNELDLVKSYKNIYSLRDTVLVC